ncbi:unnamed protein product, partial [Thlaspi arvense]
MISELPEDLLLRVFSFVPIKDAVATIGLQTLLITAWRIFKLRWPIDPVSLPKSLYLCKSLVVFNLSHKIFVDVPSPASFPSLKSLHLCYKDDESVHDNVTMFCVKVPSLISFAYLKFRDDNDVGDNGNSCLMIDTPRLKCFIFIDHSKEYCSIEIMPPLVSATISDYTYSDDKFLRPIFSFKTLEFFSDEIVSLSLSLSLSRSLSNNESNLLEPFILLLGNAATLKNILVDYVYTCQPEDLPLSWYQPSFIPGCLSSQLELFEWRGYGGRQEDKDLLTYILPDSKCLKTATICLRSTFSVEGKERLNEELKNIPRVSSTSFPFKSYQRMEIHTLGEKNPT